MSRNLVLATPAIWYPGQTEADWQDELDASIERAEVTRAFLMGDIHPDTFLDYLAEVYTDPLEVAEEWEEELEQCPLS